MTGEAATVKRPIEGESPVAKKIKLNKRAVVQETDVGITQFINHGKNNGFLGLLKQRYSDFLVNEIDMNGNVVHLVDTGIDLGKTKKERRLEKRQQDRAEYQDKTSEEVEALKEQKKQETDQKTADEQQKPKYDLTEDHRSELLQLITEEELKGIEEIFSTGGNTETKTTFTDKSVRGKLHQLLRAAFQGKLDTLTTPENTFRIALAKNSSNPRRANPQESINHVDENGVINYGLGPFKNFLHFTVYKENRETMEVASTISKFLRIPSKSIRFAGTKDRRGVTCQKFCIHKGKVARVSSLNKGLKNIVLGGFSYEDSNMGLGDLNGNEFMINIRDVKPIEEGQDVVALIRDGFASLEQKGFINYYGMQRFGTFSISTHTLGIKILNEDWRGAVDLILSEQEIVAPDSEEARRVWAETRDPALTLKKMPRRCTAEHSVLAALTKEQLKDDDYSSHSYFKSIMQIPRNLRIMYGHAYQSYIWNMVTSKRVEMFGLNVVEGDLVIVSAEEQKKPADDDFEEDVVASKFIRARALTKEDVESGKYSIYDVVLPMPGFDILYPENKEIKQVYIDVMAKDGLDPDNMGRKIREFSLAGSYRTIVSRPQNLEYEIVNYADEAEPLVRTDLEILQLQQEGKDHERIIKSSGDKIAVILKMQLGVSSYATMALREFMKADTARLSDNLNVKIEK